MAASADTVTYITYQYTFKTFRINKEENLGKVN